MCRGGTQYVIVKCRRKSLPYRRNSRLIAANRMLRLKILVGNKRFLQLKAVFVAEEMNTAIRLCTYSKNNFPPTKTASRKPIIVPTHIGVCTTDSARQTVRLSHRQHVRACRRLISQITIVFCSRLLVCADLTNHKSHIALFFVAVRAFLYYCFVYY